MANVNNSATNELIIQYSHTVTGNVVLKNIHSLPSPLFCLPPTHKNKRLQKKNDGCGDSYPPLNQNGHKLSSCFKKTVQKLVVTTGFLKSK